MKFTKMHGIGNDYVLVDCLVERILQPEKLARMVSDRHFGIGSDGLILIKPSQVADFEMEMYNADGSRGRMCGNGIRCVAKYVYEKGRTDKTCITVETLAGIRRLWMQAEEGKVTSVRVDMGSPVWEEGAAGKLKLCIQGKTWTGNCLSMGNPHCVFFLKRDVANIPIEAFGYQLEHQKAFSQGVNIEFINVKSQNELVMRVWERGSGETLACGTGACAAAAAANVNGYVGEHVQVYLPGGCLEIFWDKQENRIYMTGTADMVYEGNFILPTGM